MTVCCDVIGLKEECVLSGRITPHLSVSLFSPSQHAVLCFIPDLRLTSLLTQSSCVFPGDLCAVQDLSTQHRSDQRHQVNLHLHLYILPEPHFLLAALWRSFPASGSGAFSNESFKMVSGSRNSMWAQAVGRLWLCSMAMRPSGTQQALFVSLRAQAPQIKPFIRQGNELMERPIRPRGKRAVKMGDTIS